ncbi:hypothetical protein BS50DRAFT_629728 [Corynespora cassiicola Philippines]|uniref:BZIP domain-containing protein n=1 Tax=Corynespora cassiicola Philippines TaxID=1448308 RepID=A0A2T2P7U8_CORCC|nr:hypothetical protein BS50DRAFT_629728 [Corynespora cassiicola Philippines]
MPAERKRKNRTPEAIPDPGDPDRKRVLNVLAQRRYRERRREKIAALEAQAKGLTSPPLSDSSADVGIQLGPETQQREPPEPLEDESIENIWREPGVTFPVMSFSQDPVDFQLYPDFGTSSSAGIGSSSPTSTNFFAHPNISSTVPSMPFPLSADAALLTIPTLNAMKAFGMVAAALKVGDEMWNPFFLHTLPPTPAPNLPSNFNPTPAQIAIPHHPSLDVLPWPSLREKLICMFSLPSALRPPIARDEGSEWQEGGLIRLVQDIDDSKEGFIMHGDTATWQDGSELVEEAWEVGELFYRNWWWCLDRDIVEMSNRKRKGRGLTALRIKPQS